MMSAMSRTLAALAVALGHQHVRCQDFTYVEPGIAACPTAPAPTAAAPKAVPRGVAIAGRLRVACGFENGSYTVTLHSTDPGASFSPKTFLVNFGRIVGNGVFAVTFSTVGVQRVSTTITSNMGSPRVRGHFASAADAFEVVNP